MSRCVQITYPRTGYALPEENWGYAFILGCLTHFGLAFYNEREIFFQNLTTQNPCLANHFWILVDVNYHSTYKVSSKFVWSASVLGWTHILPWKIMWWCLWGVYVDILGCLEFLFQLTTHSIQGAFHNNFPGFSGFGFRRKLARTKTQQGTDKASEHNGCTIFSWTLFFCTHQQKWRQLCFII